MVGIRKMDGDGWKRTIIRGMKRDECERIKGVPFTVKGVPVCVVEKKVEEDGIRYRTPSVEIEDVIREVSSGSDQLE